MKRTKPSTYLLLLILIILMEMFLNVHSLTHFHPNCFKGNWWKAGEENKRNVIQIGEDIIEKGDTSHFSFLLIFPIWQIIKRPYDYMSILCIKWIELSKIVMNIMLNKHANDIYIIYNKRTLFLNMIKMNFETTV